MQLRIVDSYFPYLDIGASEKISRVTLRYLYFESTGHLSNSNFEPYSSVIPAQVGSQPRLRCATHVCVGSPPARGWRGGRDDEGGGMARTAGDGFRLFCLFYL